VARTRELRDCISVHPFTTTNKMPMIQAVHAAEVIVAKPRTQGEMNNHTPRTSEIHSAITDVPIMASAQSARMTPRTPTIQAFQEPGVFVAVPKTQGEMKRVYFSGKRATYRVNLQIRVSPTNFR